jgi:hypothetical protein
MTGQSRQPKDRNYNLVAVLYQSSKNVESLKAYVRDAEQERATGSWRTSSGASWRTTWRAAQSAKGMLVPRIQGEQE